MKQKYHLLFSGIILMVLTFGSCSHQSEITVERLTCNFREQALGVETPAPLLGWQLQSSGNNVVQSAYHIIVAETPEDLDENNGSVWDSGQIDTDQSINVQYKGKKLEPGKRYFWKVKVWDGNGKESSWSEPAEWQMGLLSKSDWNNAKWIAYEQLDTALLLVPGVHGSGDNLSEKAVKRPIVPLFRKAFNSAENLTSATLSISGLGHYEASLNGKKVGDSFLSPGWTDYDKTILYNTYDVTSQIRTGENVLGAVVGNGFYNINRERYRKLVIAQGMPKLIAHLRLDYSDGTSQTIVTDESFKTSPSPITYTSIFGGEDYDANLEQNGWNEPNFNDSDWSPVIVGKNPAGELNSEQDYPLEEMERIAVKSVSKLRDGSYLYDFGQNASGIVELQVKGKNGQQVTLWPSELISPDSTANQRASGQPHSLSYTLKGVGTETWKPKFTYYGFRYVQVTGGVPSGENNPGNVAEIEKISLLHTRNSAPGNGYFSCSNNLLNRIHNLIDWGIKSNFQSVLTDCPHREKLGWLEQRKYWSSHCPWQHHF